MVAFYTARGVVRRALFLLCACLAIPFGSRAQGVPPGQGLVADTTELRVLRELYWATGGPQWTDRTNWLSGTTLADAATWYGVSLNTGDVYQLYLPANNLRGPLPASLGELRGLGALYLHLNQLTGPLPATLANLVRMNQCFLSNNQFSGELTGLFDAWTNLQSLDLSYNQFTGPLPAGFAALPRLYSVDGSHNHLSGSLPAAWARGTFSMINFGQNQLTGPIPQSWGRWGSLHRLFLSENQLTGPLPDSLGQLHELGYLDLDNNRLSGAIPATYKGLRQLARLNLSHNALSGSLPDSLDAGYLNLHDNRFSGAVPASYATAPNLSQLTLNNNELTALPRFINKQVTITGNYLEFDSYERNLITPGVYQWFYDYGQRTPGPADTMQVLAGQAPPHPLDGTIGGAHNHYQWQRLVGNQWADMPGDTLATRHFAATTPADAGSYRTRVTNRWVVAITLYSRTHYLDVLPYRQRDRNLPVDANRAVALRRPATATDTLASKVRDINFVRTWTPRVAVTDSVRVPQANVDSVALSTTYLDGLGRPVQTVQHRASPQRHDLVQPQAYDALDREPRHYLPYAADDTLHASAQGYRYRALNDQQWFYRRTGPPGGGAGPLAPNDAIVGVARTGAAFAETHFEASPLNRVLAQGAAGEPWQLTAGHVVERAERPNTAADSVLRFQPGYDPAVVDPGYQGFYAPGELWGTDVADVHGPNEPDAHGYRTVEWKDKEGNVVMRQVEAARIGTVSGNNLHSRWLRTAYAYDDFGHLRYVVQPEGTKLLLPLGDTLAALPVGASPFLFHYRYDERGRQIAKQVPGTDGETVVVYDQLDRPVLSQDAAQRARREWSWTKFDLLGRVILSGLVIRDNADGQTTVQNEVTADTATSQQYEQRTANGTAYPYHYTTDQSFPHLRQGHFGPGLVLSVTRYDDYNFDNDAAGTAEATYNISTDSHFPAGAAPVADALRTMGLTTRTETRVLGGAGDPDQAEWLTTTTFYDERARPVQVQTTNARKDRLSHQQGTDLLTTQLDFTGKVVQSVTVHAGPSHTPVTVAEFFTYDHTGRLLTTRQQLPGEAQPTQIASVQYNEIGQAVQKMMGTGRLAQTVKYEYNIRGWLTQLNNPYYPEAQNLFNLSLHYDRGFTTGYEQYNGNLTGQTWRGRDGVHRAYGYVYDPLNRLLQGDFVARAGAGGLANTTGAWTGEFDNYRLSFASYDDNGNLLTLRRRGLLANATHATAKQFGPVDNLLYAYAGNRLQAVDDHVTGNQLPRPRGYEGAPTSLAGDFQEGGTHLGQEYLYDANGNLTQDRNKGITGIAYNHLNLPRQIHFGIGADSLVFRYTAAGQKVAKLVYQTGKPVLRTDYLGPYQYEQDSLRFFPHAEGRVLRFANTTSGAVRYQREFTFKDHLGNLRLAYRLGQVRTLTATMEPDAAIHARESQQFDSLSVSPPVAQNVSNVGGRNLARTGSYVALLNAAPHAVPATPGAQVGPPPLGPLTQFAVQKGDTVRATAFGLYPQATSSNSFAFSLAGFIASLLQPAPTAPAGVDGTRRGGLPLLQVGLSSATLLALHQLPGGVPKGYLRVLSFNEDSVLVDQRTVQLSAAALNNYEPLSTGPLVVQQNGYVSVYVGNESNADVYFDDVTIEHRQGLQVQENQYDPFGLDLAGVSGAAPGLRLKNFYQFNGKENQLDLGLNWNHQDWRFFDYQIGRWHVVDPMIEDGQENWTPYQFGYDNAVRFNDPDGQCPTCVTAIAGAALGAIIGAGIEAGTQMYKNGGHVSDWHAVGGAALQGGVTGGVAGLTGGTSLLAAGAAGAVSNAAGGAARNLYDGKRVTVGSVAKDAAVGAVAGVGGALAGRAAGAIVNRLKSGAAAVKAEASAVAETGANAEKGGLTLYKHRSPQSQRATGWKEGDRMLRLDNPTGNAKIDWKQNSGRLRAEMRKGEPIFDSFIDASGEQLKARVPVAGRMTGEFLNAERNLLKSRGWQYNATSGSYIPPTK